MCRAATAANAVGHFLEASIPGRTGWLGRVPAPRRSCDVANPLRCLGEMLATFVGRALGAAFFLLGKASGRKALHPRGEVLRGLIARHSAVGKTGVPWLDEAGTDHVAVRFSRSLGLPAPCPDILGLALRIPTQPGSFGDVLLATTGTGLLGRYVLLPARRRGLRTYTSLFP